MAFLESGGQYYSEGESVHLRIIADVKTGVSEVRLANGVYQTIRPKLENSSNFVNDHFDVVENPPYFDIFWVPDRNTLAGAENLDGVGLWTLQVEIVETDQSVQISSPTQIQVTQSNPPYIEIVTPTTGSRFVIDENNPISLVADAYDEDGFVTEVQFFINNKATDYNGTKTFIKRMPPYILNWRPAGIGEYEIKAIAIDNSGRGSMSTSQTISVGDPIGEKPVAMWHGPKEIIRVDSDSFISQYYSYYGIDFGTSYLDNDLEWGQTISLNVEAFDPPYVDLNGSSTTGGIESVTFYQNNEDIPIPQVIGEAMNKYGTIYSIEWTPRSIGQTRIYAEIIDLDGNTVRTPVRSFNVGTNVEKAPSVELITVRKVDNNKYAARVNFSDIVTSPNYNGIYTYGGNYSENQFLDGDFSVDLLINGVVMDSVGIEKLPNTMSQLHKLLHFRGAHSVFLTMYEMASNTWRGWGRRFHHPNL